MRSTALAFCLIFANLCFLTSSPAQAEGCDITRIWYDFEVNPKWSKVGELVRATYKESEGSVIQCVRCLVNTMGWKLSYDGWRALVGAKNLYIDAQAVVFGKTLGFLKWAAMHGGPPIRWWILRSQGQDIPMINAELADAFEHSSYKEKRDGFRGGFDNLSVVGEVTALKTLEGSTEQRKASVAASTITVGREDVKSFKMSPHNHSSGMSFPAQSAQTKAVSLATNMLLGAKEGHRITINSGEGGPGFELKWLLGSEAELRDLVIRHALEMARANPESAGQIKPGSMSQAEVEADVNRLLRMRRAVLKELPDNALDHLQVVGQFGGGLNGIRGEDGLISYPLLRELAEYEQYKMTQIKLGQVAKAFAKNSKIDAIAGAFRRTVPNQPTKAPEIPPGFENPVEAAANVKRIRQETGKPVSLKIIVGDIHSTAKYIEQLVKAGGLPDHFQVEGKPFGRGGGSASMRRGEVTATEVDNAVMFLHGYLMKLGKDAGIDYRGQVIIEATGGVNLPSQGVRLLALGADVFSTARNRMIGNGCKTMSLCNSGSACVYGHASRSDSMFARALPVIGNIDKSAGYNFFWADILHQQMAQSGASELAGYWRNHGIYRGAGNLELVTSTKEQVPFRDHFNLDRIHKVFRSINPETGQETYLLNKAEVMELMMGGNTYQ